jgi:hypothetical protein
MSNTLRNRDCIVRNGIRCSVLCTDRTKFRYTLIIRAPDTAKFRYTLISAPDTTKFRYTPIYAPDRTKFRYTPIYAPDRTKFRHTPIISAPNKLPQASDFYLGVTGLESRPVPDYSFYPVLLQRRFCPRRCQQYE